MVITCSNSKLSPVSFMLWYGCWLRQIVHGNICCLLNLLQYINKHVYIGMFVDVLKLATFWSHNLFPGFVANGSLFAYRIYDVQKWRRWTANLFCYSILMSYITSNKISYRPDTRTTDSSTIVISAHSSCPLNLINLMGATACHIDDVECVCWMQALGEQENATQRPASAILSYEPLMNF